MKKVSLIIISMLLSNSCDSILSQNNEGFNHCDEELFEKIRDKGSLRIWVTHDMEYSREGLLSEEEAAEQREQIEARHEQLLHLMDDLNLEYSGVNPMSHYPSIVMSVREPDLKFLCTSVLVADIREEQSLQTQ
ncbi:hypothetical protein QA596_04935 [Balneolales bacterium ANBcel1]|nr:hypothetical protein [Balneolales bacterium ANBcel1]